MLQDKNRGQGWTKQIMNNNRYEEDTLFESLQNIHLNTLLRRGKGYDEEGVLRIPPVQRPRTLSPSNPVQPTQEAKKAVTVASFLRSHEVVKNIWKVTLCLSLHQMSSVFMQEPQRSSDVYKTSKHANKQADKQTYNIQTGAAILGKGFSNFTFAAKVFPVLPLRRHTSTPASQQTNKQTNKQVSYG